MQNIIGTMSLVVQSQLRQIFMCYILQITALPELIHAKTNLH